MDLFNNVAVMANKEAENRVTDKKKELKTKIAKIVDSVALWETLHVYPQSLDKSPASPATYPHSPQLLRLLFKKIGEK